ncbi:hypothetical protein [Streptomyces sp. NPDC048111]|uniref:hypothetical protein n=1 Tax=Streptomyces sp. NPDC048111 TaxID=3365500 RepID=UPI0037147428
MNEDQGEGRLSDGEFQQMNALLRRFCAYDLDQFESVRTETPHGPVYVFMSRALLPGFEHGMFREF